MRDNDEIVAAQIGTLITTDLRAIITAAKTGEVTQYITKDVAKFMAACDLGTNWQRLANAPTIIWLVNGAPTLNNPHKPEDIQP